MTLGIFYSSYNNYDLLLDECINKIDFEDIEVIKKNGLAKGGSLENAILVK